jgi:hypothetical protein
LRAGIWTNTFSVAQFGTWANGRFDFERSASYDIAVRDLSARTWLVLAAAQEHF